MKGTKRKRSRKTCDVFLSFWGSGCFLLDVDGSFEEELTMGL